MAAELVNHKDAFLSIQSSLSIDLNQAANKYVKFLLFIPEFFWEDDQLISNAIRRYMHFWLPLKAFSDAENVEIMPPLDVHLIWVTHMLAPGAYRIESVALCGEILDHKFVDSNEELLNASKKYWENAINEPYDYTQSNQKIPFADHKGLLAAVKRQGNFAKKVLNLSLPTPIPIAPYIKFLFLAKNHNAILVPSMLADLLWHAHMLNPLAYQKDCIEIFGFILVHNDKLDKEIVKKAGIFTKSLMDTNFGLLDDEAGCGTGDCGTQDCGSGRA